MASDSDAGDCDRVGGGDGCGGAGGGGDDAPESDGEEERGRSNTVAVRCKEAVVVASTKDPGPLTAVDWQRII